MCDDAYKFSFALKRLQAMGTIVTRISDPFDRTGRQTVFVFEDADNGRCIVGDDGKTLDCMANYREFREDCEQAVRWFGCNLSAITAGINAGRP